MMARTWAVALVATTVMAGAPAARGQDNPSPEQMRKMYDGALEQLKAAQERKNQLAAENERLGQQVAAMQKDAVALLARNADLERADAEYAEKMFFLRTHYSAWQQFVKDQPELAVRWRAYIVSDLFIAPRGGLEVRDPHWPLSKPVVGPPTTGPSTVPTTVPTTQPTTVSSSAPTTHPTTQPKPLPTTVPTVEVPTTIPSTVPAATKPSTTTPATTQSGPAVSQPSATRPG